MGYTSVRIEADGGSRGNPGPAAYGAVLFDAVTGEVIAERAETIGVATNNVAEYNGLIAGLELYRAHADGAALTVNMDSKLVIEQMTGRWKIKHPAMRPLALRARELAPAGTAYAWIPRERNKHADRILNVALDGGSTLTGGRAGASARSVEPPATVPFDSDDTLFDASLEVSPEAAAAREQARRVSMPGVPPAEPTTTPPTTLVIVRHGETDHTKARRFSGLGGDDPGLNETGVAQARATAAWLREVAGEVDAIYSSPLRRTRETAAAVAEVLGLDVRVEDGIAEMSFGVWDGLTFAEAREAYPAEFEAWVGSSQVRAGVTGESTDEVDTRVGAALDRIIGAHPGQTVVAVAHVTPIKLLLGQALGLGHELQFKTELAPASVTVLAWYDDGRAVMRMFNGGPVFHAQPRPPATHT